MATSSSKTKRASSAVSSLDNDMADTDNDTPSWDASDKYCRQFVRDLKHNDWLYSQVPSARTLIERGYLRYKGGKLLMPTYDMIRQYKDGTLPTYSFDIPSPIAAPSTGASPAAPPERQLRALAQQHQPPHPELERRLLQPLQPQPLAAAP